jgi:retinal dehydrogenase
MGERITYPTHNKLFINGEWLDSASGKMFPVVDPTTEKVICSVPEGAKDDVNKAVKAARAALSGDWAKMGSKGRRNLLLQLADVFQANVVELGKLESINNGGPLAFQGAVVGELPNDIRYYAGWADKVDGRVPVVDGNVQVIVQKEPLGVCGIILPWNVPLWGLITKLGPCLAMGNTAVIKPAEQTPLTALRFAELTQQVGFPPGVINIITGFGPAGAAISSHMDIDKVAFTGSTEVGRLIMKAAAESNLKRVQLELGGKAPLVICADADVDAAVNLAGRALFTNNGELCTAGSRTFVHKSIYAEFVKKATERAKTISTGHPHKSDMGPLVDKEQFDRVLSYIEAGKRDGAKLEVGGARQGSEGYFVQPTVFSNVQDHMAIAREEIFGPVQSILQFDNMEEVIARANATPYGLSAGIVTKDITKVFQFTKNVKAGTIWVNDYLPVHPSCEFGGFKQSGFGREGGPEGIHEWTVTKTVMINIAPKL